VHVDLLLHMLLSLLLLVLVERAQSCESDPAVGGGYLSQWYIGQELARTAVVVCRSALVGKGARVDVQQVFHVLRGIARPPHIFVCFKLKSTILNFSKSYLKEFEWLVISLNASRSLALNSRFFIQFLLAATSSFVEPRGWIVLALMYITEAFIKENLSLAVRPSR